MTTKYLVYNARLRTKIKKRMISRAFTYYRPHWYIDVLYITEIADTMTWRLPCSPSKMNPIKQMLHGISV